MSQVKTGLRALLEKPCESLVFPKGKDNIVFQLPDKFYNKKYRNVSGQVFRSYEEKGANILPVKNISVPDLRAVKAIEFDKSFSVLIPSHLDAAVALIKVFMSAESLEDLLSLATYCRERINPLMFTYALSVTLLHRNDTKDIILPNFITTFPNEFVDGAAFADIRRTANVIRGGPSEPIVINRNFTANNLEPEQAVAYFREDVGINLHHWHWHLVYPTRGGAIVRKDRRGELFYYMHQQVLARYNTERLCNNMDLVKSFDNFREPILEGYFSKLTQLNSNRDWPPRFMRTPLRDLNRTSDQITLDIATCERWLRNIRRAINDGQVQAANGSITQLSPVTGIDILGNLIEATDLSINRNLYGNLHNMIHVMIALCHDPDGRFLEGFGIMGDTSTAMRDPIFYRWHKAINDLFVMHKRKLQPYSNSELNFSDVFITDLSLQENNAPKNEINTFWQLSTIDISRGLDFEYSGPLQIAITHLQHRQFTYSLVVNNNSERQLMGTVRIFMSPKFNKNAQIHQFEEERQLMIEMDKFTVTLRPGSNTIQRKSVESSVTIEYQTTFRNVDTRRMTAQQERIHNFCGCGWPDHMLVPKGSVSGFKMNLFAMISNFSVDRVDQPASNVCVGADSYCGVFNNRYPDSRSMGYPFDRSAGSNVTNLSQFLTPNMRVVEVNIKHTDRTEIRQPQPTSTPQVVSG